MLGLTVFGPNRTLIFIVAQGSKCCMYNYDPLLFCRYKLAFPKPYSSLSFFNPVYSVLSSVTLKHLPGGSSPVPFPSFETCRRQVDVPRARVGQLEKKGEERSIAGCWPDCEFGLRASGFWAQGLGFKESCNVCPFWVRGLAFKESCNVCPFWVRGLAF